MWRFGFPNYAPGTFPTMSEHSTPKLDTRVPTVLLVDDDPRMLSSLARVLRPLQIQVRLAPDGVEALAWVSAGGDPAVVISDNSMPGMTGLELLEGIESLVPTAFLVLHTGDARLAIDLRSGTMITIVAKPSDSELLRRLVWAAVRSTTERPPNSAW